MVIRGCCAILLIAPFLAGHAVAADAPADADRLLDGVREFAAPGVPGPLCIFGDGAFVVATGGSAGKSREAVVAAARWGRGRVVAFGHTGYFETASLVTADTGRLIANAVRWAGAADTSVKHPRVAVVRQKPLADFLMGQAFDVSIHNERAWPAPLDPATVVCIDPAGLALADIPAAADHVQKGGGLVAVGLGWGWMQLNRDKDLRTQHPGNVLLAPAGIVWADGTLERTSAAGFAAGPVPALLHAGRALDAAVAAAASGAAPLSAADAAQAGTVLSRAAHALPPGDTLLRPRLERLRTERSGTVVPSSGKPVRVQHSLDRLMLAIDVEALRELAPEKTPAHPAAAVFPGGVPADAPRISRTVSVNPRTPGWHGTGLYAPPGKVITATAPEAAAGLGLKIQIGSHTDHLWHLDKWHRCPEVVSATPVTAAVTSAASAFGGLVYVVVPEGCTAAAFDVRLAGCVEAPYFVLGRTDPATWLAAGRNAPAPWGELATDKVVLTVPSTVLRSLDDPTAVLEFWNRVLDAHADLAARPRKRARPERIVTDEQISAGYMHSGYPIMTHLDAAVSLVSMESGWSGRWGVFHELGHNHQSRDWTFEGTGEVTVNLFTLHALETVCGLARGTGHPDIAPEVRRRKTAEYLAKPDFERWKRDPFLALYMYIEVIEAFGWDPLKKTFAEYAALPPPERPRTDNARRDQFLVRLSRAVGRNLGPHFAAWGVPVSDEARKAVAALPAWVPDRPK